MPSSAGTLRFIRPTLAPALDDVVATRVRNARSSGSHPFRLGSRPMKRFFLWTLLVLVLAAAAVAPTLYALHKRAETQTKASLNVPDPNVVHVNVAPSADSRSAPL